MRLGIRKLLSTGKEVRRLLKDRRRLSAVYRANPFLKSQRIPKASQEGIAAIWPDPITRRTVSDWTRVYAGINGNAEPHYISGYVFSRLRPFFNNEALAEAYTDKNVYDRLFQRARTPATVVRNIHGRLYDHDYQPVQDLYGSLQSYEGSDLVLKPATETGGGNRVFIGEYNAGTLLLEGGQQIGIDEFRRNHANMLVQRPLKQHQTLADLYPASVNTIRALTLRHQGRLSVVSTVIRFGNRGGRVDNQAAGGVSCGVDADGRLLRGRQVGSAL